MRCESGHRLAAVMSQLELYSITYTQLIAQAAEGRYCPLHTTVRTTGQIQLLAELCTDLRAVQRGLVQGRFEQWPGWQEAARRYLDDLIQAVSEGHYNAWDEQLAV